MLCRASCEGESIATLDDSRPIRPTCSLAARLISVEAICRRAEELLRPIIQGRLDLLTEHEDEWLEKPVSKASLSDVCFNPLLTVTPKDDMLSWLIEVAPKGEPLIRSVTLKIIVLNFAAIHTSMMVCDFHDIVHLFLKVFL